MSAVRWEHVSHDYGRGPVLSDVSLSIEPGERVALLGHNGAGKTTLTRMLVGLVRPRAGIVTVGDWDAGRMRPDQLAGRVGYAFQHADQQLFARTVRDDVGFGPRMLGRDGDVDGILAELHLSPFATRHPYDLPAPLRKLVTLAGVFAMRNDVMVFDEPTAGFDRELRQRVIEAIRKREGTTMILVSHDVALVRAVATRSVSLAQGVVVTNDVI